MRLETRMVLSADYYAFFRSVVFPALHGGAILREQDYVELVCFKLRQIATEEGTRHVFCLPPGHLKTELCSIGFSAWLLGHDPSTRIMIVTCSENLAEDIARKLNLVLRSDHFRDVFKTRLARGSTSDCMTTVGGGVFARSLEGKITGRRADLIVVDDPVAIKDAGNLDQIDFVNETFDTEVMSRLNSRRTGRVLIVAHRLHENDLPGHVLQQRGWRKLILPCIATRTREFDLGYRTWRRRMGHVLRSDAYLRSDITDMRQSMITPDFETLYQQNPGGRSSLRIKASHFPRVRIGSTADATFVVSVDPGSGTGASSSFTVIQVWWPRENRHVLVHQWRERVDFHGLCMGLKRVVRKYPPSALLIEEEALGVPLVSYARRKRWPNVIAVDPHGSKEQRLIKHIRKIRSRRINLPDDAEWCPDLIDELTHFPRWPFSDQADALTQYLDFMAGEPQLVRPVPRASVQGAFAGAPWSSSCVVEVAPEIRGLAALALGNRYRR